MFKRMVLAVVFVFLAVSFSQAEKWDIDGAHSSIGFSVSHLVISKTTGKFKEFNGAINFDGKDLKTGSVEMTVVVNSINTEDENRDKHLRSADFFDIEKFPNMMFKSTKIHDVNGNKFKLTGDLTIKDVTKEVTFDAEFNGVVNDPWGNTKAGFTAETTINRQDFNITWSNTLDGGGLVVGNDVKINIELELAKAK